MRLPQLLQLTPLTMALLLIQQDLSIQQSPRLNFHSTTVQNLILLKLLDPVSRDTSLYTFCRKSIHFENAKIRFSVYSLLRGAYFDADR